MVKEIKKEIESNVKKDFLLPAIFPYLPMHFSILTLFPNLFNSYLSESILSRAIKNKLITIDFYQIRDFAKNKHKKVDDKPYGGGPGMVMTCQPLFDCIKGVKKKNKGPLIFLTPQGKTLTQSKVRRLAKEKELILLCGRYEGIDQRVRDTLIDEEISIGKYVLTGGELPAMVLIDTISRELPGVLNDPDSSKEDSFSLKFKNKKEYPVYTRPANFRGLKVPKILLEGNHKEIEKWRKNKLK